MTRQPPLASVLIPCFNNQEHVAEAVQSALDQTHPRVEVVVVDDGSSDRSGDVLSGFGDKIRWARQENLGACAARNHALRLSRGALVQFLDADDRMHAEKISRQAAVLESTGADVCFCRGNLFGDGRPLRPKKKPVESPEETDPFLFALKASLSTGSALLRREVVERVGGFRIGVPRAQERDLYLRLGAANAKLQLLRERLYDTRNDDRPQRITRRRMRGDYLLTLYLELADILTSGSPYEMPPHRTEALASEIATQSMFAYRCGSKATARLGFRRARQLAPSIRYLERPWYAWGAQCVGPLAMEQILELARKIRAFVKNPRDVAHAVRDS